MSEFPHAFLVTRTCARALLIVGVLDGGLAVVWMLSSLLTGDASTLLLIAAVTIAFLAIVTIVTMLVGWPVGWLVQHVLHATWRGQPPTWVSVVAFALTGAGLSMFVFLPPDSIDMSAIAFAVHGAVAAGGGRYLVARHDRRAAEGASDGAPDDHPVGVSTP
ncbi:hypothetical protein Slu03_21100 [Sediminihabitans luteus]|nr:hypothetical protein [Sediminihabitans luteus]GII99732.1 hypothetical protein Slu03_21100 [Sediminihabitans luteus]